MAERLGNLGYFGYIPEATKGVALTPTNFLPLYSESIKTNSNFQTQQPVAGIKFGTYAVLQGQRDHQGELTTLAEPNSTAHFLNALLTKGTTTGANPYTHPFTYSTTANPKSYTFDISTGNVVRRYFGVEISSMSPDWSTNELRHKIKMSALGSLESRTIASVSTTTITLKTKYDAAPNKGFVVSDTVRIYKKSTGATLDTTISTVNGDGITLVLGASAAAFAADDVIYLRPATPSFNMLNTFLWSKTQFCFGATAAAALSAAHTPVESGSSFELMHPFNNDGGEKRSGSLDPASLVRLTGDASTTIKKFFDTPDDIKSFNEMDKSALVIRHYAGDTNQYEYRITFNNLTTDTPVGNIESNSVVYANLEYKPAYDTSDASAVSVTVINALATI